MKSAAGSPERPQPAQGPGITRFPLHCRIAVILGALGLLLYANTLRNGYAVDDGTVIAYNSFTRQGIRGIPAILTSSYRAGESDPEKKEKVVLYRPLSVVMFALEWQISPGNASLGHAVNAVLYGFTGFMLFLMLSSLWGLRSQERFPAPNLSQGKIGRKKDGTSAKQTAGVSNAHGGEATGAAGPGLIAAQTLVLPAVISLLFITHPIHTEVAANIKGRDELLTFLFVILSFRYCAAYFRTLKPGSLFGAGIAFFLALLSKESAITCVVMVPLLAWVFDSKFTVRKALAPTAVLGAAAAIYLIIRTIVLHGFMSTPAILPLNNSLVMAPDLLSRLATAIMILGRYLLLLVFPYKLSFDYSFREIPNIGFDNPLALLSLLVWAGIVVYALLRIKSKDPVAFGAFFFVITISLASNVVFLIESVMGERFVYMPSLGFCIAAGVLLDKLFGSKRSAVTSLRSLIARNPRLATVVLIIAALFSVRTVARNFDWKDDMTLAAKDVSACPNSARIRYALGSYLLVSHALKETDRVEKVKLLDETIEHLERAVALFPEFSRAYYHLGVAYKEKGDFERAVYNLEQAGKYNVYNEVDYYMALGLSYAGLKQYDKAVEDFKKAAVINPQLAAAYINIGFDYDAQGNYPASIESLNQALKIDGNSWEARFNMANTFFHMGNYNGAIDLFRQALKLNAHYADAYNNMGIVYATMKNYPAAYECFDTAVRIDPQLAQALGNLKQVSDLLNAAPKK